MRTFIAFKIDTDYNDEIIRDGIERIRNHYYESIDDGVEYSEEIVIHNNIGAVIFDLKDSALLWDNVYEKNDLSLITYAPPANWKKYCKSQDVSAGPEELLEYVTLNNDSSFDFSAPTCFAVINKSKSEMDIYTDTIGFSRLYEYRGRNGWYWSNRAGALPLFSDEKAEMNKDGWASLAAAGWFIDNASPIDKVTRVKQGIKINVNNDKYQPRKQIDYGAFSNIVSQKPQEKLDLKKIAEDMKFTLNSFQALWDLPFIVDLSGGKDSRICSAAAISSGIENVEFRTVANYDDELQVAQELLSKVGLEHKHTVIYPTTDDEVIIEKNPIKERMKLFFHITDGDCTPAVVQNNISENTLYKPSKKIKVAGALGAVAKPLYYNTDKRVKKLISLKNDAAITRIKDTYFKYSSVRPEMETKTVEMIASTVQSGKSLGIHNLTLLDYFYLADRGRRWSPQSNHIDRFSVFFSNEFLTQSMNMSLDERMNADFFLGITKYLVPEWENARYFIKSTEVDERSDKKMRLWQTSDKEEIEEILNNPDIWNEYFDEEKLIKLWEDAKNDVLGAYTDASEKLFYRVMMIAHYQDHLKRVNHHISK